MEFNEKLQRFEARPRQQGLYTVSLYDLSKEVYQVDALVFNQAGWNYGKYEGKAYVCFIHHKGDLEDCLKVAVNLLNIKLASLDEGESDDY